MVPACDANRARVVPTTNMTKVAESTCFGTTHTCRSLSLMAGVYDVNVTENPIEEVDDSPPFAEDPIGLTLISVGVPYAPYFPCDANTLSISS